MHKKISSFKFVRLILDTVRTKKLHSATPHLFCSTTHKFKCINTFHTYHFGDAESIPFYVVSLCLTHQFLSHSLSLSLFRSLVRSVSSKQLIMMIRFVCLFVRLTSCCVLFLTFTAWNFSLLTCHFHVK